MSARSGPRGTTVWIIGLPCSGKTTVARLVAGELRERRRVSRDPVVTRERIEDRTSFEFIRYANCWEDAGG